MSWRLKHTKLLWRPRYFWIGIMVDSFGSHGYRYYRVWACPLPGMCLFLDFQKYPLEN